MCLLLSPRPERSGEPGSILRRFGLAEGTEAGPRLKAGATVVASEATAGQAETAPGGRGGGPGLSSSWLTLPEERECQTEALPSAGVFLPCASAAAFYGAAISCKEQQG